MNLNHSNLRKSNLRKKSDNMKEITSYMEMTENPKDVSLKNFISFHSPAKNDILNYFKQNNVANATVICPATDYITGKTLNNLIECFDDGNYMWTSEEIYHFEKYDLKLNDEFIEYVINKKEKTNQPLE